MSNLVSFEVRISVPGCRPTTYAMAEGSKVTDVLPLIDRDYRVNISPGDYLAKIGGRQVGFDTLIKQSCTLVFCPTEWEHG